MTSGCRSTRTMASGRSRTRRVERDQHRERIDIGPEVLGVDSDDEFPADVPGGAAVPERGRGAPRGGAGSPRPAGPNGPRWRPRRRGEGDDLRRRRDEHVKVLGVSGLVDEVRVDQIVHGHHQRPVAPREFVRPPSKRPPGPRRRIRNAGAQRRTRRGGRAPTARRASAGGHHWPGSGSGTSGVGSASRTTASAVPSDRPALAGTSRRRVRPARGPRRRQDSARRDDSTGSTQP